MTTRSSRLRRPATAFLASSMLVGMIASAAAQSPQVSKAEMRAIAQVCKSDVETLCKGVQPGGGRIGQCLQQNAEKVSAPCQQKLSEVLAK